MNRLHTELHRLYLPPAVAAAAVDGGSECGDGPAGADLVDADGRVRAMVLELARPADWAALSVVWAGVQADLHLPAPAIAVSGLDGIQLWFSLAQAVPVAQAAAFLDAVRERYLPGVAPQRLTLLPQPGAGSANGFRHASLPPARRAEGGRWSAFVAADLAPVFADEPALDMPPNPDGQAQLLARLRSIAPDDFTQAGDALRPAPDSGGAAVEGAGAAATTATAAPAPASATAPAPAAAPAMSAEAAEAAQESRQFLLDTMRNVAVSMALRIEAAKALLG